MNRINAGIPFNNLPHLLPFTVDLASPTLLRAALQANKYLAELKGYCQTLPNPELLLNTVILQESKDSSAIENIVTTQDELYQAILNPFDALPANSKEVIRMGRQSKPVDHNSKKRKCLRVNWLFTLCNRLSILTLYTERYQVQSSKIL